VSKKLKFPPTIAVSIENEGDREEYLQVNLAASEAAEVFKPKRIAIYKLVDEGSVLCSSQFVSKKRKRA